MPTAVNTSISATMLPDRTMAFLLGLELKTPLIALKLAAEQSGDVQSVVRAEQALRTIDSVMLCQRLQADQQQLQLEPVHIGSIMSDILDSLQSELETLGYENEIYVQHGITTVDADRNALRAGLECMLQTVIAAAQRPSPIKWHVFSTKDGVRISLTNNSVDLSTISMPSTDMAIASTQPVQGIAGSSTQLITAKSLFEALGGKMRKVRRQGGEQQGFGVTLQASAQLMLV